MHRLRSASAVVAIVLLGAGAAVAGCGDDEDTNDYVDQINDAQIAYVEDVTELVSGNPPTTPDAVAEAADGLAGLTEGVAEDIAAVEPPEDVSDLHERLVGTLEDVAAQITGAGETLASGSPQQAAAAAGELQQATTAAQTELNSLIDEINSALEE